jgi:hypothetical protein
MIEYTNIFSQLNSIFPNNTIEDFSMPKLAMPIITTAQKAQLVLYALATLSAVIIANSYFTNVHGYAKIGLILMAAIFNIPFIFFWTIYHVQLKDPFVKNPAS